LKDNEKKILKVTIDMYQ